MNENAVSALSLQEEAGAKDGLKLRFRKYTGV